MLIGKLANEVGTTVRALRYYEQQGLLHPRRTPNGYREYDEAAVHQVGNIRLLLSLGLTSQDVRAFEPCLAEAASDGPLCAESAHVINRKLAEVEGRIAELDAVRKDLLAALARTKAGT
jgi:DNA-binding transcriptional MerR regulator